MAIVMFLGNTPKEYNEKSCRYLEGQDFYCAKCGAKMNYHSYYNRSIRDYSQTININRVGCLNKECRHTEAVLPDFLLPYKQYSANEIEAVIIDSINLAAEAIDTVASISTVRRWIRQMQKQIHSWIEILMQLVDSSESSDKDVRSVIHADKLNIIDQLSLLIETLPFIRKSGNLLGAALIYLSNPPVRLST